MGKTMADDPNGPFDSVDLIFEGVHFSCSVVFNKNLSPPAGLEPATGNKR